MPTINDSASGASYSSGSAAAAVGYPGNLSAYGASQSSGDANATTSLPNAALSDFGIWDNTGVDPAISCLLATTPGAPDSRAYAAAYAPVDYVTALGTLWHGAAFAALRATWNSTGQSAISAAQFEPNTAGTNLLGPDAADYRGKLVYQRARPTVGGTPVWDAIVSRSQDHPLTGKWSGKLVNDGAAAWYSMDPLAPALVPASAGKSYTGSVWVALPRAGATWTAGLHFYDSSGIGLIGTWQYTAYATHPGGNAYQPSTATAVAPAGTAYVAVVPHIQAAAIGDGEIAYVDCHRVTCSSLSTVLTPSAYSPARRQNITVRANRVNYVLNPSFATDTYGWWINGGGAGTALTQDPTVGHAAPGAGKVSCVYTPGSSNPQMGTSSVGTALLTPGLTYTLSAHVLHDPTAFPLRIFAVIGGGGPDQQYILGNDTTQVLPDAAGWYRLWVTVTVPVTTNGVTSLMVTMRSADWTAYAGNTNFWVDDALAEPSPLLGDYFDGSQPSPDYMWEATPNRSRSHYYRDFRSLQYRLSGLVSGAVPMGVPYQLSYAQPDS